MELRKAFLEAALLKRGLKLTQLESESFDQSRKVARPAVWTEDAVGKVIQALHKICVESLDGAALKDAIRKSKIEANLKDFKSLKLLELWLSQVENVASDSQSVTDRLHVRQSVVLQGRVWPTS